jgi:hypothetical protein
MLLRQLFFSQALLYSLDRGQAMTNLFQQQRKIEKVQFRIEAKIMPSF